MSMKTRDPLTGHETTGHEWNGITELNARVPRVVWFFIAVTHIWALGYWVLMPAWPLVERATPGVLGIDQREVVEREMAEARALRADWQDALTRLPAEDIRQDEALMARVRETAPALYGDNCAVCHGANGEGALGYPSLADDAWLWGSDTATIMETLRVGINAEHPETRIATMPAFGTTAILDDEEIAAVADYVQSFSGQADAAPARLEEGAAIYAANCAACHGAAGEGVQAVGAPNLTDNHWIYGGDDASLFATIYHGRAGWMPHWSERMTPAQQMILTLYIQDFAEDPQ